MRTLSHILALIIGFAAGLYVSKANAWEPKDSEFYKIDKRVEHPAVRVKAWRKLPRPIPKAPPVVVHVNHTPVADPRCIHARKDVGDQALTEGGARKQAIKAWSQSIRAFNGEQYADYINADHVQFRCWKASISGGAGLFHRCEITATPCHPKATNETGDRVIPEDDGK